MATFCLTQDQKNEIKRALKDRRIDPAKLVEMTSAQRRDFLAKFVGKDNAVRVNALFESKLLLKNQKAGYITWAKKISGISKEVRRDMIAKIERLDKALSAREEEDFLEDLTRTRLGLDVTEKETKTIFDLSRKVEELRQKADAEGRFTNDKDRLSYGMSKVILEKYINDLKLKNRQKGVVDVAKEVPGVLKSIQASLDNSFFGRQGIKVLYNNPGVWFKNFLKSWVDIGKELAGLDALDAIKADIYSRPNSLNGKYGAGGYQLDVLSEEAYPSTLPGKIPLLGRLFKASESAYNGAALRIRADLADKFIKLAEENGMNMLRKEEARPIGDMVGSMTGRGRLRGLTPEGERDINVLFYSIKFLKSNIDTLMAVPKYALAKATRGYNTKGEDFAAKQAAKASLRVVGTIALILATAKALNPDSVDEDPRGTNFGKIKIFGHWVDITGGMGAIVRLAARIVTGESKNSQGETRKFGISFGDRSALDELEDFVENKFSPLAGMLRDKLKGQMFGGEPFSWGKAFREVMRPLPVQTSLEILKDPKSEFALGSIILEALGFSTNVYNVPRVDWNVSKSKELIEFRKKVGEKAFQKANDDFNRVYEWWYTTTSVKETYKRLSQEQKDSLKTKAKEKIKAMIFKANKFKYKTKRRTEKELKEEKKLLP